VHLVGADRLRDTAGLQREHLLLAELLQDRALAVVDVAHDGDDRGPGLEGGVLRCRGSRRLLCGSHGDVVGDRDDPHGHAEPACGLTGAGAGARDAGAAGGDGGAVAALGAGGAEVEEPFFTSPRSFAASASSMVDAWLRTSTPSLVSMSTASFDARPSSFAIWCTLIFAISALTPNFAPQLLSLVLPKILHCPGRQSGNLRPADRRS